MSATTVTVSQILQDQYLPGLIYQFNNSSPNLRYIRQNSESVNAEGTKAVFAVQIGYNEAVGTHGESSQVPASGYPTVKQVEVKTKQVSARAALTYRLMRRAKTQAHAFARGAQLQMESTRNGFTLTANSYLWGDGTGVMCRVKSQTVSTNRKLKLDQAYGLSDGGAPESIIRVGQTLHILDTKGYTDGVSVDRGKGVVEMVDMDTGVAGEIEVTIKVGHTINFGAATGVGDYVYLQNTIKGWTDPSESVDNTPPMGMLGFYDHALVPVLQGIDVATDPWWKPNKMPVAQATARADMRKAFTRAEKRAGEGNSDGKVAYLISSYETRDRFADVLEQKVEYRNVNSVDGHVAVMVYNGRPWFADHTAPDGRVFFKPQGKSMERHASDDFMNWVNDGQDVLHLIAGTTTFEAIATAIYEYGIRRRNHLVSTTGMTW